MTSFFTSEEPSTALQELGTLVELLTKYELVAESNVHPLIDGVMSVLYEHACKTVAEESGDEVDSDGSPTVTYTPNQIFDHIKAEDEASFITDLRNSISIAIFDVTNPDPVKATIQLR